MSTCWTARTRLTIATMLVAFSAAARGQQGGAESTNSSRQDPAVPTTQPATTQASQPINPLPSPKRMMDYFYDAVREGRSDDALQSLNFGQVDEQVRLERGEEYVAKLGEILNRLEAEGHFDRSTLADDPDAPTQTIGKDPILLVLERQAETEDGTARWWQFSASTVADVPEWHAKLDDLLAEADQPKMPAPETTPKPQDDAPVDQLRSPYHAVQFFLVNAGDAMTDPGKYTDAMKSLDLSQAEIKDLETDGPPYVDQLGTLLEHLRVSKQFDREKDLPKEPSPDLETVTIGKDPITLILVRQADTRWRFSAATVKKIPDMIKALDRILAEKAAESGESDTPVQAVVKVMRLDTSSPQATLNLFLTRMGEGDIQAAVRCLNLSRLSDAERGIADILAGKLLLILNRHALVVLQEVPDKDEVKQNEKPYTMLTHIAGRIEIDLQRGRDDPREGEWLFTAATVRTIDNLYEAFESKPILPELQGSRISFRALPSLYVREYLIPVPFKRPLLSLQVWQWIGVLLVMLLGLLCRQLCAGILPRFSRRLLATDKEAVLPEVARKALLPTSTLAMVAAWWGGLQLLDLGAGVMSWTWWGLRIVMTVVAVYAFYRIIDLVMVYFRGRAARTATRLDDVLVPLLDKTLKVVVVAVGFLVIANAFGFQITPLLTGLGLGGLAFALAAQDTIKNLFGSVTVVLDGPFQVGDWVKIGNVEGTVEAVGLRSSRIRTFYNSLVTVPNAHLINATVDNMGRRRFRRISCKLGVTYSTSPEQLEAFCEGIRELIRRHPYTRKDYYLVWVNEFSDSAINILLYCFHETPDWTTELRERHRLLLDIMRLAKRLGVEFAFPTQTIHLETAGSDVGSLLSPPTDGGRPARPSTRRDAARTLDSGDPESFGRDEAARIVREQLGDSPEKPPPFEFPKVDG